MAIVCRFDELALIRRVLRPPDLPGPNGCAATIPLFRMRLPRPGTADSGTITSFEVTVKRRHTSGVRDSRIIQQKRLVYSFLGVLDIGETRHLMRAYSPAAFVVLEV